MFFVDKMTDPINTVVVPAVVAKPPAAPVKGEKPEKFSGQNFKRWQQKDDVLPDHTEFSSVLDRGTCC